MPLTQPPTLGVESGSSQSLCGPDASPVPRVAPTHLRARLRDGWPGGLRQQQLPKKPLIVDPDHAASASTTHGDHDDFETATRHGTAEETVRQLTTPLKVLTSAHALTFTPASASLCTRKILHLAIIPPSPLEWGGGRHESVPNCRFLKHSVYSICLVHVNTT